MKTLIRLLSTKRKALNLPNNPVTLFAKFMPAINQISQNNLYAFPKKGKSHSRSFHSHWFKDYNWLHYDKETDGAFCFVCVKALQNNALRAVPSHADMFVKCGYRNWKKALGTKQKDKKQKQTDFPAH